jgi:hypothetical protein
VSRGIYQAGPSGLIRIIEDMRAEI